ncbi:MAG: hypothetical protein GXY08_08410 [Ruminococcus sp.]|nr:hypothetical protein [Ruminococcus sp.]
MTKYRIIAFLTAFSMTASLCSCSLRSKSSSSECIECETTTSTETEIKTTETTTEKNTEPATEPFTYDLLKDIPEEYMDVAKIKDSENLKEVRSHVSDLFAHLKEPHNSAAIEKDINLLLDDIDKLEEISVNKMIPYYLDFDNTALEEEYDDAAEDVIIGGALAFFAFNYGSLNDDYGYLFEDLCDNDDYDDDDLKLEEYGNDPEIALKHWEMKIRAKNAESDELLDEYHNLRFDQDMDTDEKNKRCAELYLEIIKEYDQESYKDKYHRDYTGDEILDLGKAVREELVPLDDELWHAYIDTYDKAKKHNYYEFDDPFIVIQEKAPKFSKSIANAADMLVNEKLYYIAKDDSSYNLSFMDFLPASKKALIYYYNDRGIAAAIHEFGHFYASTYDNVPYFLSVFNTDIAEIQSQGFEFIFSTIYDDIYGEEAETFRISNLRESLFSVISGFMIGEFEYTVIKNKDTFTPDDVLKCWNDIESSYEIEYPFYYVNHIFENPGYYISYGVSALAAFDIWQDCISDKDKAVKKYEKIAKVSCSDKDNTFRLALKKTGFNDVLNKEYIIDLADKIREYINSLE